MPLGRVNGLASHLPTQLTVGSDTIWDRTGAHSAAAPRAKSRCKMAMAVRLQVTNFLKDAVLKSTPSVRSCSVT